MNKGNVLDTEARTEALDKSNDELPVIPLWIDGHAYLTITAAFGMVRRASDGAALRRIPISTEREVDMAIRSASEGAQFWRELPALQRRRLLTDVGAALADYAAHFAYLIEEESGKTSLDAEVEVRQAVECLSAGIHDGEARNGVVVVTGNAAQPLLGALCLAVPAWLAGAAVIVHAPSGAPSALFAVAELTARCAWPGGVFCLLHGGAGTGEALRKASYPVRSIEA